MPPLITISAAKFSRQQIEKHGLDDGLEYVNICFSDNGIGTAREHASKVFQIFQRLHGKSEYEGTGIGLSICKKIALNHHGDIVLGSQRGPGARFQIIFPLKQTKSRVPPAQ